MRLARDAAKWTAAAQLATIGTVMGACVGIGLAAGWWLDKKLGTGPWLAVVGTVLGSIAAFRELIRMVSQARERQDQARDEQ